MTCGTCKHLKVRRGLWGLVGLCLQHWHLYRGLMRCGHAPYRCALRRGCEFYEPLNNKSAAPGAEALAEADAAAGPGEAGRAASTDRQGDAEGRA